MFHQSQPSSAGPARVAGPHRRLSTAVAVASLVGFAAACGSVGPAPAGATGAATADAAARLAGPAQPAAQAAPARCSSGTCFVAVNVATMWVKPWYPRPVDQPALGNPAYPDTWVRQMTTAQKAWLVGKLETQALYGTKVVVTGHWKSWSHVVVPSQPTNRDRRGYPGWVPTVQLTSNSAPASAQSAIVRSKTAWLWSGWQPAGVAGQHVLLVSYDTRLSVVRATSAYIEVALIGGRHVALRRQDAVLHARNAPFGGTRAKVLAEARRFLGLPYLWAGVAGFGYDCSGFTYSMYHTFGITLSRDADQQAVHGTAVARSALQPGDLVFFRASPGGPISHVGMYVGGGNMIDAPNTSAVIRYDAISSFGNYAGARRYLSG